jgi:hypothetical protein
MRDSCCGSKKPTARNTCANPSLAVRVLLSVRRKVAVYRTPVEILKAAGRAFADRSADHVEDAACRMARERVDSVALCASLHVGRPAFRAVGVAGEQERGVDPQRAPKRADRALAIPTTKHVGKDDPLEPGPVPSYQTPPAGRTRGHVVVCCRAQCYTNVRRVGQASNMLKYHALSLRRPRLCRTISKR